MVLRLAESDSCIFQRDEDVKGNGELSDGNSLHNRCIRVL